MPSPNTWSFPHPLLSSQLDDVASTFRVTRALRTSRVTSVEVEFDVELDDEDMLRLLENGAASIQARARSGAAFTFVSAEPRLLSKVGSRRRYVVTLKQSSLRGIVTFEIVIVATTAIDGYRLSRQNPVFGDAAFTVRPGDILGVAYRTRFDAVKDYDPLNPPLDACFRIERHDTVKTGFELAFDDPTQIVIKIASPGFNAFKLQGGRPEIQIGAIMFPALIGALDFIRASEEELDDSDWYQALANLVRKADVEGLDPYRQAQIILEDPTVRLLEGLATIGEEENE